MRECAGRLVSFGKIAPSFVKDIVMPPIGKVMGGVDFACLSEIPIKVTKCAHYTSAV